MKRPDDMIVAVAADLVEASQELGLPIDQVAYEASQYARHLRKVAYAAKVRAEAEKRAVEIIEAAPHIETKLTIAQVNELWKR